MGFGTEILFQVQEYPNPSAREVPAWGRHCLHTTTCQQGLYGFLAKQSPLDPGDRAFSLVTQKCRYMKSPFLLSTRQSGNSLPRKTPELALNTFLEQITWTKLIIISVLQEVSLFLLIVTWSTWKRALEFPGRPKFWTYSALLFLLQLLQQLRQRNCRQ